MRNERNKGTWKTNERIGAIAWRNTLKVLLSQIQAHPNCYWYRAWIQLLLFYQQLSTIDADSAASAWWLHERMARIRRILPLISWTCAASLLNRRKNSLAIVEHRNDSEQEKTHLWWTNNHPGWRFALFQCVPDHRAQKQHQQAWGHMHWYSTDFQGFSLHRCVQLLRLQHSVATSKRRYRLKSSIDVSYHDGVKVVVHFITIRIILIGERRILERKKNLNISDGILMMLSTVKSLTWWAQKAFWIFFWLSNQSLMLLSNLSCPTIKRFSWWMFQLSIFFK